MARLSLNKVEKTYPNGFKAVHGVDLEVRDGEFMVFVGPSGCAKSTLLRMIAGLESITAGELRIGDKTVNSLAPKERGIAMVFQNYALYPHMKVYDNLAFGLKLAKTPPAELDRRVRHAARLLEMEHLLDRYPKQLSGGQAQRVAVGRAIVKKPDVFLFDEPLSNLDAKLRAAMRVRLTELHRTLRESDQPATTVYVTHDQVEAMTMGERICVLKDGVIQQVDTPTALYERPANAFVAGFIGSPEMNLLPARLEATDNGLTVQLGGTRLRLPAARVAALGGLAQRADGAVTLGLRPEHLTLAPRPHGDSEPLAARLRFSEHMGSEVYLHVDLGDLVLTARIPAEQALPLQGLQRGDPVTLHAQMSAAHLFDADTGVSLLA
ncbi:ABC transporter ATP-binding protein [Roseateles depolymerans]|uniref:sn-glycerol-3-phosphate import ATP-binding protein ugpC n=1 Tax=Roseateles depolymerans TaxID=76731 RepID=A0A0U3MFC8_9BURK|nr:sn-glycerol-3-phosphate ABC transporter ATP-binding protein UgpC [Roseateles depolymerans]ALV07033.1 sn-glycerol-3-phosphate import ATP-binding protein ugpC [Roseateles depolymerans]REG20016.1 carbohydrate ABC transporter ATP-binding protein (CUT1 family) [Roseateles depolymerans]